MTIPIPKWFKHETLSASQNPEIVHWHAWVSYQWSVCQHHSSHSILPNQRKKCYTSQKRDLPSRLPFRELWPNRDGLKWPQNSSPRALGTSNWLPSSRKRVGEPPPLAEDTGTASHTVQTSQGAAPEPTTRLTRPQEPEEDPKHLRKGLLVTKFSWAAYTFIC